MRLFLRSLLFTFFALTLSSVTAFSQTATIKTDQLDYPPGSTVIITGTGWQPGETVTLQVLHEGETGDNEISGAHAPFTAIADGSGNISSTWTVPYDEDELGATLVLTAVGGSSGLTAQWTFTDALPDITASPALGSSSGGYQVTLTATSPSSFNSGGAPYSVTIDGVPVSSIVVVSAKVITFTAPAHTPGNVSIVVNGKNGPATNATNFTYGKADQTITFGNLGAKIYGDAAFALGATSSSGLTVSYSSSNTNVATITGNIVTIVGAGSTTITASQVGDNNYNAATSVGQTLTVNKADQTITWTNPADITYGTLLSATQLNAVVTGVTGGSATGAVTYTPAAGTLLNAGTSQTLHVDVAATDNYNAASKDVSINVNKAEQTITWNNPADITYGTLLSGTQLNAVVTGVTGGSATGAVTYTPAAGTLLNAGASQT
ncbi:MAG: IPT/TIG domain-containing protein, partial [Ginsengibacter sp.]